MPMVMNVACRTVSGPLCIKGDHSDVMYLLNTGWIILFADEPQKVYDFNLLGLKLAEAVRLPVAVAFDGFFTSHQKRKCLVFEDDDTVTRYIGEKLSCDNPKVSAFAGTGTGGAAGALPYASGLDLCLAGASRGKRTLLRPRSRASGFHRLLYERTGRY